MRKPWASLILSLLEIELLFGVFCTGHFPLSNRGSPNYKRHNTNRLEKFLHYAALEYLTKCVFKKLLSPLHR